MAGIAKTSKARALGDALREARDKAKVSQYEVADRLGKNQSTVSRWEKGSGRPPSVGDVTAYLDAIDMSDDLLRGKILSMASGTSAPSWLARNQAEQQIQRAALLRFERGARKVTHVATALPPGPLQQSDYARKMMEEYSDLTPDEIDTNVAVRVGRRELITREDPAMMNVLLGEAALRQGSDRTVVAKQVRYLIEMADYPNISIRVVPFTAAWLENMFIIIETDDEDPIVHVDVADTSVFLHEPKDVDHYRRKADVIEQKAMNPESSKGFMADIARELEATL